MADTYENYAALSATERLGTDYEIRLENRGSRAAILAPHGGRIEPGTSEIARAIAGTQFNHYCFEGTRPPSTNGRLHITSAHFDEPSCLHLVSTSDIVITVHGCKDREGRQGKDPIVYLGGLDRALMATIESELQRSGFECGTHHDPELQGRHPNNICNRGSRKMGVQLEMSRTLRDSLVNSPADLTKFASAVQRAIAKP
jgi:phage replication-related protein YjqB (UPF0714/DUF867 family)